MTQKKCELEKKIEESEIRIIGYSNKIFHVEKGYIDKSLFKWRSPPLRYTLFVAAADKTYIQIMELVYEVYMGQKKKFWNMTKQERTVLYKTQKFQWDHRLKDNDWGG